MSKRCAEVARDALKAIAKASSSSSLQMVWQSYPREMKIGRFKTEGAERWTTFYDGKPVD